MYKMIMAIQSTHSNTLPKNPYLSPPSHINEVPNVIREIASFLSRKDARFLAQTSKTHCLAIISPIAQDLHNFIAQLKKKLHKNKIREIWITEEEKKNIQSDLARVLENILENIKASRKTPNYPDLFKIFRLPLSILVLPSSNTESLDLKLVTALAKLDIKTVRRLTKKITPSNTISSFAKKLFSSLRTNYICNREILENIADEFIQEGDLNKAIDVLDKRSASFKKLCLLLCISKKFVEKGRFKEAIKTVLKIRARLFSEEYSIEEFHQDISKEMDCALNIQKFLKETVENCIQTKKFEEMYQIALILIPINNQTRYWDDIIIDILNTLIKVRKFDKVRELLHLQLQNISYAFDYCCYHDDKKSDRTLFRIANYFIKIQDLKSAQEVALRMDGCSYLREEILEKISNSNCCCML